MKLIVGQIEGLPASQLATGSNTITIPYDSVLEVYSTLSLSTTRQHIPLPYGGNETRYLMPKVGSIRYSTNYDSLEIFTSEGWSGTVVGDSSVGTAAGDTVAGQIPPVTSGLYAQYNTGSFIEATQVWTDITGNGRSVTNSRGIIQKISNLDGNGVGLHGATAMKQCIAGGCNSGFRFPAGILPDTYTLFHVARYAGGRKGRLFDGQSANWLSGFHSGNVGVAYHNGWMGASSHNNGATYWLVSMDQNSRYRANGNTGRGGRDVNGGGGISRALSINWGNYSSANCTGETTDWMVAEVIVYDRTLAQTEFEEVENWLKAKYGINF